MTTISPQLRQKLLQQQSELLVLEAVFDPFDDEVLSAAWQRCDDLEPDDAWELRRGLLETQRLIDMGRSSSRSTAVSVADLVGKRGHTRQRLRQLDDEGLLAVVWDNEATRRSGYVLDAEIAELPERIRNRARDHARQRELRRGFVAGRPSSPASGVDDPELPECLR